MTHKSAYIWGPISSFAGPLTALLLKKGWHVDVATKSALNLFTLAPLDLDSTAQSLVERALGGHDDLRTFQERLRFLEIGDFPRGTTYDAVIFCGLPPNYDESRVPRAPWAAGELAGIVKALKGVPVFIISSLWSAVQPDGVVPEELEFERRKPKTHWEALCQQYESRLLASLSGIESSWHLIRLPMLAGSGVDGSALNFSGLFPLVKELSGRSESTANSHSGSRLLRLAHNPDSTTWFLPVDSATYLFWRLLEDGTRPRICNLVSTQATLNREVFDYLARALRYEGVEAADADVFQLPTPLRVMLTDDVHVRTRNLFEVAGRYQLSPARIDESYFEKLLSFGTSERWGRTLADADRQDVDMFTEEIAVDFFERFLPSTASADEIKELTGGSHVIAMHIQSPEPLTFVLQGKDGALTVSRSLQGVKAKAQIYLPRSLFLPIVKNKHSLHRALILREVRVDGGILEAVRAGNGLARFIKDHPYTPDVPEVEVVDVTIVEETTANS